MLDMWYLWRALSYININHTATDLEFGDCFEDRGRVFQREPLPQQVAAVTVVQEGVRSGEHSGFRHG